MVQHNDDTKTNTDDNIQANCNKGSENTKHLHDDAIASYFNKQMDQLTFAIYKVLYFYSILGSFCNILS